MSPKSRSSWDPPRVKRLRRWLEVSQRGLADELSVRQQTVSDWETGVYQPRGASAKLLDLVAERCGFVYGETPERSDDRADPPGS